MIKLTIVIYLQHFSVILSSFIIVSYNQIYKLFSIDLGLLYVLATGTSPNIFHFRRVIYLSNRIYIVLRGYRCPKISRLQTSTKVVSRFRLHLPPTFRLSSSCTRDAPRFLGQDASRCLTIVRQSQFRVELAESRQ